MARFITALLLVAVFKLFHGADSFANVRSKVMARFAFNGVKSPRQDCSSVSQQCVAEFSSILNSIGNSMSVDDFNELADDFCSGDCGEQSAAMYQCLTGDPDAFDPCLQNSNGRYCFPVTIGIDNTAFACGNDGICDSAGPSVDCQNSLQTVVDDLGCCIYALTDDFPFDTCNITAPGPCNENGNGNGAGFVSHVGFGVLTVFLMATVAFNLLLF